LADRDAGFFVALLHDECLQNKITHIKSSIRRPHQEKRICQELITAPFDHADNKPDKPDKLGHAPSVR
ncbi:MAG: hypothetical protein Q4F23_06155, partial [Coriobacteriia bacterium]|nr:hypothetical protein [Coriobacteriia bacterium]